MSVNQRACYRKTIVWQGGGQLDNYYWDKEVAIASIPPDHPIAISMTVYDNNGGMIFGRKFSNQIVAAAI
ncbi:hypothetical protein [Chamaesiphon sp.]|uniref:hypothetical protein n=1 Tax=Chamaesiphon sp. TaxID=2814140 RepID=UPI0035940549